MQRELLLPGTNTLERRSLAVDLLMLYSGTIMAIGFHPMALDQVTFAHCNSCSNS
jgi:hypothetical protein